MPVSRTQLRMQAQAMTVASDHSSRPDALPRLLVCDFTRIDDPSATGQLKATLFADWPQDRLFQLFGGSNGAIGVSDRGEAAELPVSGPDDWAALRARVAAFAPEAILYRPIPDPTLLHRVAMDVIRRCQVPLITWIVDDWPAALKVRDPRRYARLDRDLRALFAQSAGALSIGDAMSAAFGAQYGIPFTAFANGVDPRDWGFEQAGPRPGPLRVRYGGGLADNMGLDSLVAVAGSVERLAKQGVGIALEIGTRPVLITRYQDRFADFAHTTLVPMERTPAEYREWIAEADILALCYNFDESSKAYVRYSIANKLPEYLASAAPVLAFGPKDVATMALLEDLGCTVNILANDPTSLDVALRQLSSSRQIRHDLGRKAREIAFARFNIDHIRAGFMSWIAETASRAMADPALPATRRTEGSLWSIRSMLGANVALTPPPDDHPALAGASDDARRQALLTELGAFAARLR